LQGVTQQAFCEYLDLPYSEISRRAGNAVEHEMRDFENDVVLPHMNDNNFSVTWVEVANADLRKTLEKCAVALMSNYLRGATAIDAPTSGWLGRHSHKPKVQRSGLWNQDYVTNCYSDMTPGWLDSLEQLI